MPKQTADMNGKLMGQSSVTEWFKPRLEILRGGQLLPHVQGFYLLICSRGQPKKTPCDRFVVSAHGADSDTPTRARGGVPKDDR